MVLKVMTLEHVKIEQRQSGVMKSETEELWLESNTPKSLGKCLQIVPIESMLVIKPLTGLTMISNNTLLILKVWQVETMKTIRRISGRTLDMKAMTISSISSSEKNLPVTMISHIGHKTLRNKAGMSMVYSSSVHIPVATVMTCMELAVNSLDLSKCSIIQ